MGREKIVIFGISTKGMSCYYLLKDRYEIVYFCDNNMEVCGEEIDGVKIISPAELSFMSKDYDRIILASSYYDEIIDQLIELGIDKPISNYNAHISENVVVLDYRKDYKSLKRFISGELLNFGLKISYSGLGVSKTRDDVICELLKGKSVVDVGCADHISSLRYKIIRGDWLHARIKDVAEKVLGIDINKEAIEELKKYGHEIVYLNVLDEKIHTIVEGKWDYILLADVLEHIARPVEFLESIMSKSKNIPKILISVPNALEKNNFEHAKNNIERINTDHKYWFTPYTLEKILYEVGMKVDEIIMCGGRNESVYKDNSLMKTHIVVVASKIL